MRGKKFINPFKLPRIRKSIMTKPIMATFEQIVPERIRTGEPGPDFFMTGQAQIVEVTHDQLHDLLVKNMVGTISDENFLMIDNTHTGDGRADLFLFVLKRDE